MAQTFETIATAKVGKSAHESQQLGFLRPSDTIEMNIERVLATAKAKALSHGSRLYQRRNAASVPIAGAKWRDCPGAWPCTTSA
jgi:3-hydroxyacyl-CoA dehydrogenase